MLGKPLTATTKSENYAIWLNSGNRVRFEVGNGTTSKLVGCDNVVFDTNWHHVVATFASGTLKIYVDGTLCATATATFTTAATNTNTLDIGHAGTGSYFGGSLDEAAIYSSVLTATQIADHYSKGHNPPPTTQTTNYGYDHNANQTSAGTRTFTYDATDQLASTTSGTTTDTYAYDGDGNRLTDTIGSTTTKYLWDSNNPLPELALERDGSNNLLRRYTYGNGIGPVSMTTPAGSFYYHHDTLRNIANLTNASGTNQWTYSYEPYGIATAIPNGSPPANPIQYNAQYQDTTGLYNFRAREYDPSTGRFNGLDPTPAGPTIPYEASYDYAGQDPILTPTTSRASHQDRSAAGPRTLASAGISMCSTRRLRQRKRALRVLLRRASRTSLTARSEKVIARTSS